MIKKEMKNARGISLISLSITIVVILILSNVMIYSIRGNLKVEKLKEMQNDIVNLRDKVSSYYAKNGSIPIKMQYANINDIRASGVISEAVDTGEFFVIDLTALENLTLNRGQDFEKIKLATVLTEEQSQNLKNLYIINETSHNIFYVEGVTVDNETFYTDYTAEEIDKISVDLRYVDNIKIPDGFYYVSGTREIGIIIRNADKTETYKWMLVENAITEVPVDVEIETTQREKFIKSVNIYKGYYKSTKDNRVIYLETENVDALKSNIERIRDSQSVFTEKTKLKDKYENEITIPKGFKIALDSASDVTGGIVIEDAENTATIGSQFVWVPVGNITYENGTKTIELNRYTFGTDGTPTAQGNNVIEFNGHRYQELATSSYGNTTAIDIEAFKTSVIANHGYYIGRYEAGDSTASDNRTAASEQSNPMVCKENQFVYNYISQPKASILARGMYINKGFTSDLINSYAWDTAIVYIQEFSGYKNYANQTGLQNTLAKTGKATNGTSSDVGCNIYDMAGNCYEWTTESVDSYESPCVSVGGSYSNATIYTCSRNYGFDASQSFVYSSFRPILYL